MLSIGSLYKNIKSGEKLSAQINLKEVAASEKVDVVATYVVKDFSGKQYLEESETFFVKGDRDYVKEFDTSNLGPGKYILGLEVFYPGAFATSSSQFNVEETGNYFEFNIIYIVIVLIVVVIGVFVWYRRSRTNFLARLARDFNKHISSS